MDNLKWEAAAPREACERAAELLAPLRGKMLRALFVYDAPSVTEADIRAALRPAFGDAVEVAARPPTTIAISYPSADGTGRLLMEWHLA